MGIFHHARGCRCGICQAAPPDGAYPELPSLEPDDESGFAPASGCAEGECDCYGEGYARGKYKAHFEVKALAEGPTHGRGCGCEPCLTVGAVIAALVREAAHAGLSGCGLTGGKFCGCNDAGERCPGWPEGQERGNSADLCPLVPTGCILADLLDYVGGVVPPTGCLAVLEADALARRVRRGLAGQQLAVLEGRREDAESLAVFMTGLAGPGRYDGGR